MSIVFIETYHILNCINCVRCSKATFNHNLDQSSLWTLLINCSQGSKKTMHGSSNDTCTTSRIVWCKNIVGCKILPGTKHIYLVSGIWYLVTDISDMKILCSHGSERNNASEQQRHLHNEQRRLNNRLHNNIRWKNLVRKNIIWWCGKLSTTGCTATSETPVLPALQLAPCTTCSAQQI